MNERLTPAETPDGIEYVRHTCALPITIEDGCWIGGGVVILPGCWVSVWSMFHSFISVAPWFLFFVAIEHLGELQLAVANILRSISTLFFVIVNSLAATTGSLVSKLSSFRRRPLLPICSICGD